jgi:ribonucleoside-diphosphate reductase alpha chain
MMPAGTVGLLMDCDTTGIEPEFSLVKTKLLAGGGQLKIVNKSIEKALSKLGYDENEIRHIVKYVAEHGSMEGAPYIKENDLDVFNCAVGEIAISPLGHVKMVAAIQPYISMAISKTVNMPHDSTVEDIKEIFLEAHRSGIKCISVYRDGCKVSQPLKATVSKEVKKEESSKSLDVPKKRDLPKKRPGWTRELLISGHKVFLRTGEFEDGSLGEIFIDTAKDGATLRSLLNCFAIAISMGLQYGVPLESFVRRFSYTNFEPKGVVSGHEKIKFASSMMDMIFRVLGYDYLGLEDVNHKEDKPIETEASLLCSNCGNTAIRTGNCSVCTTCGTSMGCS